MTVPHVAEVLILQTLRHKARVGRLSPRTERAYVGNDDILSFPPGMQR